MKQKLFCKHCGQPFKLRRAEYNRQIKNSRQHFFCCHSCSAIYGNVLRTAPVIEKKCRHCGKAFTTKQDRHEADFCSRKCASAGSVTPFRRERARIIGKIVGENTENLIPVEDTLWLREKTKYTEIARLLHEKDIHYQFEFRINNYVFDLALPSKLTLIEFDGPEHRTPKGKENDAIRDAVAKQQGWAIHRIPVAPNQKLVSNMIQFIL